MLPAAAVGDRLGPPDAGRAIEVEEAAGPVAPAVLEHEVGVEQDRLHLGQQRVILVQVRPARLHHRHLRVAEVRHGPLQEVGRGDEVGVEDRDVAAAGHLEGGVERAGLVAATVVAVDVLDIETLGAITLRRQPGDVLRLVGRVVEDLDFELLFRVVHPADGLDQPVHHVHFVEERQLHRHRGPGLGIDRRRDFVPLVLHVKIHKVVAMPAVHGQDTQDEEVGPENQGFSRRHSSRVPQSPRNVRLYRQASAGPTVFTRHRSRR